MLLRSSVSRVVHLEARSGATVPPLLNGGSAWRSGERRVCFTAWSVVRDFKFTDVISKLLKYSILGSNSSATPTAKSPTGPAANSQTGATTDRENPYSLSPAQLEAVMSSKTKYEALASLHEVLVENSTEIVERCKKEAVFHEGDVLANRYLLVFKHGHKLPEYQRAMDERQSWNTLWKAMDTKTSQQVTVEVNEAGDPGHYTAAVRSASLHALAGQHPNILQLLDVCEHRTHKGRHAVVVTERAGSDLARVRTGFGGRTYDDLLMKRTESSSICMASRPDGIRALKSIARQLFRALEVLHKRGITHMDIHDTNILLDKPFEHHWLDLGDYVSLVQKLKRLTASSGSESTDPDAANETQDSTYHDAVKKSIRSFGSNPARADTYHEGNLQSATIKLTGFGRAVFNSPMAAMQTGFGRAVFNSPMAAMQNDVWSYQVPCDRDGNLLNTPLHLRAPEEILGLNFIAPSYDIWRAGLTLFHLATARELFQIARWKGFEHHLQETLAPYGNDDFHLFDLILVLGTLPRELIRRSPRFNELYLPSDNLKISRVFNVRPAQREVSQLVKNMTDWKIPFEQAESLHQFITHILIPDPARRPTAAQVLKHPWLNDKCG